MQGVLGCWLRYSVRFVGLQRAAQFPHYAVRSCPPPDRVAPLLGTARLVNGRPTAGTTAEPEGDQVRSDADGRQQEEAHR